MDNEFTIITTHNSIIVLDGNGEHIAEYASRDQKVDAAAMRRAIRRHLAKAGNGLGNYGW